MKPSLAASLLVTTVTASLLLGSCTAALATEPTPTEPITTGSFVRSLAAPRTLSSVQVLGAAATAARIRALDTAIPKVTANVYPSTIDKDHVLGTLNGDRSAMVTLGSKIAADTDLAVATADFRSILTGYRIFAVAIPQSFFAAAVFSLEDSAIPALQAAQAKLTAAIDGPLASKDTPAIDAAMADLATQISTARKSISGVSALALSVTQGWFNTDDEILAPMRAPVKTATAAAKKARVDVTSVRTAHR